MEISLSGSEHISAYERHELEAMGEISNLGIDFDAMDFIFQIDNSSGGERN